MKIIQINATCGIGSTGKICVGISETMTEMGIENYIFFSSKANEYKLGIPCTTNIYIRSQAIKSKLLGNYGFNSKKVTRKIIRKLECLSPDIVHLHNIHGHDCNLEMLFSYFKSKNIKVVWTFHDCWAFTGYCTHFTMMKCDKWRKQCFECMQKRKYSWLFDKSNLLFEKKKNLFQGLNLTIVTPSRWLADLVKQSFFKDYPVEVINNGINLNIFKYSKNNFRQKFGLENKKLILGVSFCWDKSKGLDVFIKLAETLKDEYLIALVGTNDSVDKLLPKNIISIHKTQNQQELAEIYSAADVFINPTREDTYPTVNMEALACGTPVITFKTGGSPEMLDETCGIVVDCDNMEDLEKQIMRVCDEKTFSKDACLRKAKEFDQNKRFKEYIELYERVNAK